MKPLKSAKEFKPILFTVTVTASHQCGLEVCTAYGLSSSRLKNHRGSCTEPIQSIIKVFRSFRFTLVRPSMLCL